MKVIFLDFDGVLHDIDNKITKDFELVYFIEEIIKETDAKIVISSDWRHTYTPIEIKTYLLPSLKDYIIGETPFSESFSREIEIKEWLDSNEVEKYVILDDIEVCMSDSILFNSFIRTNADTGITKSDVQKAIDILKGELNS